MTWYYKIIGGLIIAALIFFSGSALGYWYCRKSVKPEIKIVEKTKIEYKTKYRDYAVMTNTDILEQLKKYDTAEPTLDGTIKGSIFHANAGLNGRTWSRDFTLEVNQTQDWRFLAGAAGAGLLIGGISAYLITK